MPQSFAISFISGCQDTLDKLSGQKLWIRGTGAVENRVGRELFVQCLIGYL